MRDLFALRDAVGSALVEAGVPLHDCIGEDRDLGGCCMSINHVREGQYPPGVIVSWTCAQTLAGGGPEGARWHTYRTVQDTMTEALWAILEGFGFEATPYGRFGLPLVTALRRGCEDGKGRCGASAPKRASPSRLSHLEPTP